MVGGAFLPRVFSPTKGGHRFFPIALKRPQAVSKGIGKTVGRPQFSVDAEGEGF